MSDHAAKPGGADKLLSDVLSATRRPDGYAVMLLDLDRAEEFRLQRARVTGVELTPLDLFIKALALTAGREPLLNATAHGYRVTPNEAVDIGISVAADTAVAPVVVLRDAIGKTLEEIHELRAQLLREAVATRVQRRRELERQARLIPFDPLRRKIVAWLVNQPSFRKEHVGTLHISTIDLPDMEFYMPSHLSTSLLLSVGGVKPRALVVDGRVEVRTSAYCAFMIDQRAVHPLRAMRAFRRFRRLLENPEKLV